MIATGVRKKGRRRDFRCPPRSLFIPHHPPFIDSPSDLVGQGTSGAGYCPRLHSVGRQTGLRREGAWIVHRPTRQEGHIAMNLIASVAAAAIAAGASLVFWPTLYGLGLVASTLLEVLSRNDRFLWGAIWLMGSVFGSVF